MGKLGAMRGDGARDLSKIGQNSFQVLPALSIHQVACLLSQIVEIAQQQRKLLIGHQPRQTTAELCVKRTLALDHGIMFAGSSSQRRRSAAAAAQTHNSNTR